MAPIDRGFNRLAWLVPYAVGVGGLVLIVVMARRWSRAATVPAGAAGLGVDAGFDERLDDELRNLD
jgi:cytochrome c-type biogenesis protein CcmH/NrfF